MKQYYNKIVDIETRWTDIESAMKKAKLWKKWKTALDIGCAEGEVTRKISEFTTKITALDIEQDKINNCPYLKSTNFVVSNIIDFKIEEFDYELIFYLGVHHKLQKSLQYNVLKKLYPTKAIIIQRAPIKYCREFIYLAFEYHRNISFYIPNKDQGPISICFKNK